MQYKHGDNDKNKRRKNNMPEVNLASQEALLALWLTEHALKNK